jgi:hypothetical protein
VSFNHYPIAMRTLLSHFSALHTVFEALAEECGLGMERMEVGGNDLYLCAFITLHTLAVRLTLASLDVRLLCVATRSCNLTDSGAHVDSMEFASSSGTSYLPGIAWQQVEVKADDAVVFGEISLTKTTFSCASFLSSFSYEVNSWNHRNM